MTTRSRIALLLFGSGMCALIYQVTWLRELRLVFGASTPATASVLAVFMGGLGFGSLHLSRRAERSARPLALYANLELLVALMAAITPLLLWLVRSAYIGLGGTMALGSVGGTIVRLVGSTLVLLPATFLMGGTLPAAARAAERDTDGQRRNTALLYGANTVGAVVGAALTTFVLMEVFGTRLTLWLGCTVNALVAMVARALDRTLDDVPTRVADADAVAETATREPVDRRFVLGAAAAVGAVFLALELVWYRMLAPLLGGSTYTFGLILAVALLGVGAGGLLYASRRRPTIALAAFAGTCALEAVFVAVPFALGDNLALLAAMLRPLGTAGLWGHALGWSVVTGIVVLPAAVVAGYQFPLLIALLGRGRRGVARDVGLAYAWNTGGAIAGSLAGGFVLLPWLSAPGAWIGCVLALAVLGTVALLLHGQAGGARRADGMAPAALVVVALAVATLPQGPTAVWRHSPIGTGRANHITQYETRNELRHWLREQRYAVTWEADGRESSVALHRLYDTAFIVNGKTDGSAIGDATTQIMGGMLGAMLHGNVKRAMVIGLGTGSTAGWLGTVPGIERVDVVEIEPAIRHVAAELAAVNQNVLANDKVVVIDGDAREVLLTQPEQYDLIFSEPSNPYRAGIASLFTRELYEAVRARLAPGGVFIQWLQGYDIDAESVQIVYATLSSAFGSVASWRADVSDLLLIARADDVALDKGVLEAAMQVEPYKTALMGVWRANDIEALFAHHIASPKLAAMIAGHAGETRINTDDRNLLEFALARALGRPSGYSAEKLRAIAGRHGFARPRIEGDIDWDRVAEERMTITMARDGKPAAVDTSNLTATGRHRHRALRAWTADRADAVLASWDQVGRAPRSMIEHMVVADALATVGKRADAEPLLARLREHMPTEAAAIAARGAFFANDDAAALSLLSDALTAYRSDPWPTTELMLRTLALAPALAKRQPSATLPLFELLQTPFVTDSLRYHRQRVALEIASLLPDPQHCVSALRPFEPHAPWDRAFLELRVTCYERARHANVGLARDDLALWLRDAATPLEGNLVPATPQPPAP